MPFKTALENLPQQSLLDASAINNYYSSVGIQSLSPSQIRRLKKVIMFVLNLEQLIIFIYHQNKLKNYTQPLKNVKQ